jgi:hypothetical protein
LRSFCPFPLAAFYRLDASSSDEWKEPVLQLLLHTFKDPEQLLRSKDYDGDEYDDDEEEEEEEDDENEDDEVDDLFHDDEDDEDDDQLLLQLLLDLEKEVFLLYLSSDDLKVATEDSLLHLLTLWMMKKSPELRSSYPSGKPCKDTRRWKEVGMLGRLRKKR